VKKINPALWSRIYLWWQWLLYWSGEVTAAGSLQRLYFLNEYEKETTWWLTLITNVKAVSHYIVLVHDTYREPPYCYCIDISPYRLIPSFEEYCAQTITFSNKPFIKGEIVFLSMGQKKDLPQFFVHFSTFKICCHNI